MESDVLKQFLLELNGLEPDMQDSKFSLDEIKLAEFAFRELNLDSVQARSSLFESCIFEGIRCYAGGFNDTNFVKCKISDSNFRKAIFNGAQIRDCVFSGVDMSSTEMVGITIENSKFIGCNFGDATICDCMMKNTSFQDCNFSGASVSDNAEINVLWSL